MAATAKPGGVILTALLLSLPGGLRAAPVPLSLAEAAARKLPDYTPAHLGQTVVVRGQVSSKPIVFARYAQVGIQDEQHGLILDGPTELFDRLLPGDEVEVAGKIAIRAGLAVLVPAAAADIKVLRHGPAPAPQKLPPDRLQSFEPLGRLVVTQGRIREVGANSAGAYLLIGHPDRLYRVFVPSGATSEIPGLAAFAVGDLVQVTGIASQYCPFPPHNRWFQLTSGHPSDIVRLDKGPVTDPRLLAALIASAVLLAVVGWFRERRMRVQRQMLRTTYALGEEILGAPSNGEILNRLKAVLPKIFGISRAYLYVYNRGARTLDEVVPGADMDVVSIPLETPPGKPQPACVACFQNKTLLLVPDTRRSPFPVPVRPGVPKPKALVFVPLFAQGDVVGVLEMDEDHRRRVFSRDEQTLAQHLANQIGVAAQLLDRRSVREQLFRTEKLAAVGRLISGVVTELRAPLESISQMLDAALAHPTSGDRELLSIAAEARKASEIVARLVAFAGAEQVEAAPTDVNRLLRNLIELREREWKARGIRVKDMLLDRPLHVVGSPGQLEQVLLTLLVHAEQAMTGVPDKQILARTSLLAKRVLVEISYKSCGSMEEMTDPLATWSERTAGALGLDVCRSIIVGHGGEIRWVRGQGADCRFEIELPWMPRERPAAAAEAVARDQSRQPTALLMEPEESVQRRLVTMLSARGYRVVPVHNSDVALDLVRRMRFDVALCSTHLPGLNWVELSERIQPMVSAFVLLSDGHDRNLAADFEGEGRFVLAKPVEEDLLDRVLGIGTAD